MHRKAALSLLAILTIIAFPVRADWDDSLPFKWVQHPDLSPMGIDVMASYGQNLADDFECTVTGPLTDIHIWGSWYHDVLPEQGNPDLVDFVLTIYKDIPAEQSPNGYSQPGDRVWQKTFPAGSFVVRREMVDLVEGWMEYPDLYEFPGDTVCWQYNFFIPPVEAFIQQGAPGAPVVYWLGVSAMPVDGAARFGWKTSLEHWNDDAVWAIQPDPPAGPWQELRYPPQHEMAGQSIDLAFVITGEAEQQELDFGDAPDPTYPTMAANFGASHGVTPNLYLGASIDPEPDGQPDPNALGDDNNIFYPGLPDDEDGVIFTSPLIVGQMATVDVISTGGGLLNAWIDFLGNGNWFDAGEQIFVDLPLANGLNNLSFMVPAGIGPVGQTFARFRLSYQAGIGPRGSVPFGEVEDYEVFIGELRELDFGDAPDANYQTLLANNGAHHLITPNLTLGLSIDAEPDGQPHPWAWGDDNNILYPGVADDEDGVAFITALIPGQPATVQVTASAPAMLQVWFDWDSNGDWNGPGEWLFMDYFVAAGVNNLNFVVPAGTVPSTNSFARFRLSTLSGVPSFGFAPDGEVEDYRVTFPEPLNYKWRQGPDLEFTGIDVNASRNNVLADDFLCRVTGPITEIHIWGSWLNDWIPFNQNPLAVDFTLSLHADIPAGTDGIPWSRPGEVLWVWDYPMGSFEAIPYALDLREGWMFPPADWNPLGDTVCWEYIFPSPAEYLPWQYGSPDLPVVYWLDVKAVPQDPDAWFGWKTSLEHWNDDAVWGVGDEPFLGPWDELRYPPQHPFAGESIDLAFAFLGDEVPVDMDFGDAPDPSYPTLLASDGARHLMGTVAGLHLGALIDPEPNGQPDAAATGDDNNGLPDEDGVVFLTPLIPGQTAQVQVTVTSVGVGGILQAWFDWDANGDWMGAGEQVIVDMPLTTATHVLPINVPASAAAGATSFARFRISSQRGLGQTGLAMNGEVEDYMVRFEEPQTFKWMQRPDLEFTGIDVNASRNFVLADDFECRVSGPITEIHIWGSWLRDWLPFNQDPLAADFILSLHADIPAGTDGIPWSRPGELLWVWGYPAASYTAEPFAVDLQEGWMNPPADWDPAGDTVCWEYTFLTPPGEQPWQYGSPQDPQVYWLDVKVLPHDPDAWFGWKTSLEHWNDDAVWGMGEEPFPGPWEELRYPAQHPFYPESIDLAFALIGNEVPVEMDFGDAPDPRYPTLLASGGARHVVVPGIQLGQLIDAEGDGQPTIPANGDDINGIDDEDGVVFLSPLGVGQTTFVDVTTPGVGLLNLWIDFGGDGSWNEPGDHVMVDLLMPGGVVNLPIPTPASAVPGPTYARFRFSRQAGLGPTGPAINGEVEDYPVRIFTPTGNEPNTPKRVQLHQNVPNPFNPHTTIRYELPREMGVQLAVYDLRGGLVKVLVNEVVGQGIHETPWDGRDEQGSPVASGIYVVRLQAEGIQQSTKVTLVR